MSDASPRALLLLVTLLLTSCALPPPACGTYPEDGGPAEIRYRGQELCELVRQRMYHYLNRDYTVTHESAEAIWNASETWHREPTVDDLVSRISKDVNPQFGGLVARSAAWVLEESALPWGTCAPPQRCLVQGAAEGARLALVERDWLIATRRARHFEGAEGAGDVKTPEEARKENPSRIDIDEDLLYD